MGADETTAWFKVAEPDELPEGRVTSVSAGTRFLALVHFHGAYAAMDNHCPHQGGPLGEGSIEKGVDGKCWLRCPWHGWDFDPLTGKPPGGHEDTGQETFPVEVRADGVYVGVPKERPRPRTAMDVMAETMTAWGVTACFGMVGHSNLGLADALRLREEAGDLRYYGIRHEGAAAFACSGYAKLTGHPAACLTIAGPGATNLLTGLWDAKVDRAPVLALTGQVNVQVFGPGSFQEIDLASAFSAVSRFSHTALHTSEHGELMALAVKNALVHRDVSHLIFPDDVQTIPPRDGHDAVRGPEGRMASTFIAPDPNELERARDMIGAAKRPILVAGFGAREAREEILALAETLQAPILTTFKGKGLVPDDHPLAAGVLGRSGTPIASWFMNECDLIIALGASFSDHTGVEPSKPIIQVDFDPLHIGKKHPVALGLYGEVARTAAILADTAAPPFEAADQVSELAERWAIWRKEKARRITQDRGKGVNSAAIFDALTRLAPEECVFSVDVGNNTYSFGRYLECKGDQRVLMSGYLGSIGFSFPAAMGAWAATKEDPRFKDWKVISISGDGGFGQYAMEFATAVKYGMNITHILLNNAELGKISKEQRSGEWPVWQTGLVNPSFAAFARLCGGKGVKVDAISEVEGALQEALAHKGPSLVEIMTDAELV